MDIKRKIYKDLIEWKNSDNRKPLILQGARQVGKTYIVNMFGQNEYANTVYCNFEQEKSLHLFFENLVPNEIIANIENYKRVSIVPKETLLIFDEIQACPQAITSLKYFCEQANNYHIIAMGSLLGVSMNRKEFSFPVGKVEMKNLHPLDFEEFLSAKGENNLTNQIKSCFENNSPLATPLHDRALQLYRQYLFIGGMPEVVVNFISNKNYDIARSAQQNILTAYFNDMGKYNKYTEIPKTRLIFQNISTQLAKENKKFKYALLKSGGRAKEFAESLEWLCCAGIAHKTHRLAQVKLPLNANLNLDDFKLYMNDVGLCGASENTLARDILFDNILMNDFKGGLVENYVSQQLTANGIEHFYWTSENKAELDFVVRLQAEIVPIEVKSGDRTRSKSLGVFCKKYNSEYAVRISAKNFGFENGIKSVPLYAVFCLKK